MTPTTGTPPSPFNCRHNRHKVITTDRICVLCGAKNATDARKLPPLPQQHETPALAAAAPLILTPGTEA